MVTPLLENLSLSLSLSFSSTDSWILFDLVLGKKGSARERERVVGENVKIKDLVSIINKLIHPLKRKIYIFPYSAA
jgi:hypothetical protein